MARERRIPDMMRFIRNVLGRWLHLDRPPRRQLSAHHEAAHAVAAVAMGIGLARVSVVGDCDTLGRTLLQERWPHRRGGFDPKNNEHRRIAEDWIILSLVGENADALHESRHPDRNSPGAKWDLEHAEELASWLFDDVGERSRFLERMHERAQTFVTDPLRWCQISAVAMKLVRYLELDGQQVEKILDECIALRAIDGVMDSPSKGQEM